MFHRKILPIHSSFRIIALAEPPNLSKNEENWLTSELLNYFIFHSIDSLTVEQELGIINTLVPFIY